MNIKQLLLASSCALFLASCNKNSNAEKVDYVLFSGKVSNVVENEISVFGNDNGFQKAISINEDGTFSDTLKIESKGSYGFMIGRERSSLYLDHGDQLELTIDTKQFDESIKYTGTAADANNYLAEKALIEESLFAGGPEGYKKLFVSEVDEFKKLVSQNEQAKNDAIKKYKDLGPEFATIQTKDNRYEYLSMLNNYQSTHSHYTKKEDYKTPEGFLDELKDFNIDNAEDYEKSNAYRRLSSDVFYRISQEKAAKDSISMDKAMMENLAQIKSKNIKNAFIKNIAYQVSPRNENAAELYDMLMAVSDDDEFKSELTNKFEKIKVLVKGNQSPVFNDYENYKGGTTSLSDLKGKYVYIDVWATWCGPCKAEIPHLKKIEKQYHNKNIEFVSISIDKKPQHDTWKTMVKEKELGGVQLFADNDWRSQFIVDYGIRGIPRFILIDPEGKIVSASAPRPSDSELIEVFNKLNI
ncbi:thiol-disulfide isomerase/thioredoxin [Aquimarina sp. MAR_2010_214]|uniref:TlpA family protein disulfide reductase n=1 Tax=Aquimarina sp. MAR_2010_214 TaxID=1250026 RepID=UPI000CB213C9|nr:TlpA disulfide reductase family protein [Aquimarina sp. MAR_2010_214]PKV52705.1 thiol-disulfide isomerase/thioredoxin [Aquimarina sp. MAR_2010_214]